MQRAEERREKVLGKSTLHWKAVIYIIIILQCTSLPEDLTVIQIWIGVRHPSHDA